jgi:hypothetical protein
MAEFTILCARCTVANHGSNRFCETCGLPLGVAEADADAGRDALGAYEAPEWADADLTPAVRSFIDRAGFEATRRGHGWCLTVPLESRRKQAVYVGLTGTDREGRVMLSLVSVCGPANVRDARIVLMLNAHAVEAHFAIKVLRGEEYFVVVHNRPASEPVSEAEAGPLVERVAQLADGLERRISGGGDLY